MAFERARASFPVFVPFLLALFFSLGFYGLTGHIFIREDLSDFGLHYSHALDPFGPHAEYYPPVFSLLWAVGARVLGSFDLAYIFLSCLILFFLIPLACFHLSLSFWGRLDFAWCSFWASLLGSGSLFVFWVDGIIPQALALVFLLLGLEAMQRDIMGESRGMAWSVALWGVLGLFTHQRFVYIYAVAVVLWLYLSARPRWAWKLGAGLLLGGLVFLQPIPFFFPGNIFEIVVLWMGGVYLLICLAYSLKSMPLADYTALACLLSSFVDPMARPVLFIPALLSYRGTALFSEEARPFRWVFAISVVYLLALVLGVLGHLY